MSKHLIDVMAKAMKESEFDTVDWDIHSLQALAEVVINAIRRNGYEIHAKCDPE